MDTGALHRMALPARLGRREDPLKPRGPVQIGKRACVGVCLPAPPSRQRRTAVLYVGGSRPGVYGAGRSGATPLGEALLVKYVR
jgi:hypothetical protein